MKILSALLTTVALIGVATATQDGAKDHGHDRDGHAHAGQAHDAHAKDAKGAKSDAKIIAEQLPSYPLKTCAVSGEGLDEMGGPLDVVQDGRLVRLCCKGCVRALAKNPKEILGKIELAVVEQQKKDYPLTECAVSGEKLGSMGDPIEMVHGTRLVRLCCKGCLRAFKKDPAKHMAAVDKALIAQQKKAYPLDTCLMSGNALDSDKAVDHLYGTKLIRFCCPRCKDSFLEAPEKAIAKMKADMKKKKSKKA